MTAHPAETAAGQPGTGATPGAERFFCRELSWMQFNRRVLEEAQDGKKPLIERARFLAIVSSNLDEFVMVRMAELWELAHGFETGETSKESASRQLVELRSAMAALVADEYQAWRHEIAPQLAKEGFTLASVDSWDERDRETLRRFYVDQIQPVLTPLAVDPTRPFPLLVNRGIAVAVSLVPEAGGGTHNALVAVPQGNRLVSLHPDSGRWALSEDVVMAFLDALFPGYRITGRCLFRTTRDGSLEIDEDQEEAADLLSEIEQELRVRDRGHVVRLEIEKGGDQSLQSWLLTQMALDPLDAVSVDGPLDLTVLNGVSDRLDRADLRDPPLQTFIHPRSWEDPFETIRAGEILLHHPFQSFQRVVELVEFAAKDPQVLAIKQTLYRVSGDSPIVKALVRAARAGKQVTVLVELKARFDEAANIRWARTLEEAGAHVTFGLVGYKVHAKLLMIIRREEDGIVRYCQLGTGNYNDKTARFYTDFSYMTSNEAIGRDVAALFNMLTGYSRPPEWERLAVAPLTLRKQFNSWIRREAEHAQAGRGGRIIAKFNSLVDTAMAEELYAASSAGVQIDLIVRGMCILRPGVPGLSENIRVRSVIGRLLEHSRIYHFANDGDPVYAIASADWMSRNLDRRVECLTRIEDPRLCERLQHVLDICLADNQQARVIGADGNYHRLHAKAGEEPRPAQEMMLREAQAASQVPAAEGRPTKRFRSIKKRSQAP